MKTALLLCSTHNDFGLIFALRKLGWKIIVSGDKKNLPGEKWADEYVSGDYSDRELMLQIARERKVDAVISCCNDFGVYTAAYIAEKLGLPGYDSYETTLTLHNKDRFKKLAETLCIQTPESRMFSDEESALAYLRNCQYPVIVKPTDASAGNGVSRADDFSAAKKSLDMAFKKSRAGRVVLEHFVSGSQHGFCTFLRDQKVVAVCSNNEYSFENAYRVEIDTYPADSDESVSRFLISQIEIIARHLKLKDGIFHLQYIMDGGRPMIIEVMRRILGNMYHVPGNWLTDMDWEYWQVRVQCGLPIEDFPCQPKEEGFFAYKAVLARADGIVSKIVIPGEYERYIRSAYWLKHPGDVVVNHLSDPIGFLFFMFPDELTMRHVLIDEYRNDLVTIRSS